MTVELVRLVWRVVTAAAPSWTLWFGLTSLTAATGTSFLFYERCRRRTYVAVLEAIQPGTLLLERTHRHKEILIVRLSQPWLIARSDSAGSGGLRR
jgi:hypothetical protein